MQESTSREAVGVVRSKIVGLGYARPPTPPLSLPGERRTGSGALRVKEMSG